MQEEKQEKLPLDAKLLSDAVIELNISRRSVGLYPPEHPIVRASIERAFNHLQKLFEIRGSITLGIAKDALVVDEYILDRKNPVFKEFAESLHAKGIAAVTFYAGLSQAELKRLHELITAQDMPVGKELVERAATDLSLIQLSPIDFTNFTFIEGAQRTGTQSEDIWEDYIYGLLEGKLADGDDHAGILSLSPEKVANVVNAAMTKESVTESYDRVITAYIRKKGGSRISSDAFHKFFSFIEKLKPEIKQQFLARAGAQLTDDIVNVEAIIKDMTPEAFEKIAGLFTDHASLIPTTLKNLIEKLSSVKQMKTSYFDFFYHETGVLHDIELGEDVIKLFGDDNFHAYVNKEYQQELDRMLAARGDINIEFLPFQKECDEEAVDAVALDIMLHLLQADFLSQEDYRSIVSKILEFLDVFIETGRFQQILETFEALSSHAEGGRFMQEAAGSMEYFATTEFITNIVTAITLWGRRERDGAIRLAEALRNLVVSPLFDALEQERDPSIRKFLLSVIEGMGSDVIPHAVSRLNDGRWFVVRNMIYLIRECKGTGEADKIRKLVRHDNATIRMEAVKTLLHFRTPDAISHVRTFLQSEDPDVRKATIRLAGTYKVREVVPALITYLEKRDLFGTETFNKIDIVRALGEIGDIRAVASLQKILTAVTILYKGNLEELKLEIFKTLDRYPLDAVKKLIDKGLSSKNEEIRTLSEKYLMAYHDTENVG